MKSRGLRARLLPEAPETGALGLPFFMGVKQAFCQPSYKTPAPSRYSNTQPRFYPCSAPPSAPVPMPWPCAHLICLSPGLLNTPNLPRILSQLSLPHFIAPAVSHAKEHPSSTGFWGLGGGGYGGHPRAYTLPPGDLRGRGGLWVYLPRKIQDSVPPPPCRPH